MDGRHWNDRIVGLVTAYVTVLCCGEAEAARQKQRETGRRRLSERLVSGSWKAGSPWSLGRSRIEGCEMDGKLVVGCASDRLLSWPVIRRT